MTSRPLAFLALLLVAPALHAQKWTSIGRTSSGNEVFVDARSIKRTGSLVSATVRAVFTPPVQMPPKGVLGSSRTTATFDCAKRSLAAKENVLYSDAKGSKVVDRKVNKLPGFSPALKGSLGEVAMTYLCKG